MAIDARTIAGVSTATTAFVGRALTGPVRSPTVVQSFTDFERVYGGLWRESPMTFAVRQYFENGGSTAVIARVFAQGPTPSLAGIPLKSGDILGSRADRTGMYALVDADIFNLLCLPPPAPNAEIDQATWTEAAKFCQEHRAMLIVDAPDESATSVRTTGPALVGTRTYRKNAALFYPRIRAANPLSTTSSVENYVPCGAVAGIFARTDSRRGVWKSPAGMDAKLSAIGLTQSVSDRVNGDLNSLGINCLRTFPGSGTVVWGARTMDGADTEASEWKYVPVRRTALFIEESLYRGLQWVVSEPNGEPLWAQVRQGVEAFMQNLFRQGAFAGRTPREAYFVKCDKDTTTTADISRGVMNLMIGFAPLKPAEFVIIKLQLGAATTSN